MTRWGKLRCFDQQYHQETTGLKYPLAVSNPSLAQRVQASTEAQLQIYLERSASSKAEELAEEFALERPTEKVDMRMAMNRFAAFRSYLLTVLMSLGGQAIREAEVAASEAKGKRLEASGKNIFNLLPKTPLTVLQAQLPDEINPAVWDKRKDSRFDDLLYSIGVWFAKEFLPECKKIAAAGQDQQLAIAFNKITGLADSKAGAWLVILLSGEEDLFAANMLIPDKSDLPPEKVERGARQGAQLTPGGNPTQAIPFETRFPTTHIPLGELEAYTEEVIDSLHKAHR